MKLAHLSDLHLGGENPRRQLLRIRNLIDRVLETGVDHLMLGGDLVDDGDLKNVLPLVKHLKERKFFSAERLSVVPGNHDIWPYSERVLFSSGASAVLGDVKKLLTFGEWPAQKNYLRFLRIFAPSFEGVDQLYEDDVLPCVKRLDGVAIAMLDTTSERGYLRSAQGRFESREGRFLIDEVASFGAPKILLMHHAPWRLGHQSGVDLDFTNLAAVTRFIRKSPFNAVLYGHLHGLDDDPRSRAFTRRVGRVATYGMGRSGAVDQDPNEALHAWHELKVSARSVRVVTRYVSGLDLD